METLVHLWFHCRQEHVRTANKTSAASWSQIKSGRVAHEDDSSLVHRLEDWMKMALPGAPPRLFLDNDVTPGRIKGEAAVRVPTPDLSDRKKQEVQEKCSLCLWDYATQAARLLDLQWLKHNNVLMRRLV